MINVSSALQAFNSAGKPELTRCAHCNAWINPKYGADSPSEHHGHSGTKNDPRSPGDYDNICDLCNYEKGLRGGPGVMGR